MSIKKYSSIGSAKKSLRLDNTGKLSNQYITKPKKPPDPPPLKKQCNTVLHQISGSSSVTPLLFTASLLTHPAQILIDSGSSGNFISSSFIEKHKIKTVKTREQYKVTLADGSVQPSRRKIHSAPLSIEEYNSKEDLIVLPLSGYDSILGMPWLTKNNPKIDWKNKYVELNTIKGNIKLKAEIQIEKKKKQRNSKSDSNNNNNQFNLEKEDLEQELVQKKQERRKYLLSLLQFKKEIKRNQSQDKVYLCLVKLVKNDVDNIKTDHKLNSVIMRDNNIVEKNQVLNINQKLEEKIVEDNKDLFPQELPHGLPPKRFTEHRIELELGATPASRGVYRMSPTELEELKKQLNKLVENGFIRPSESPWGAPVLFIPKKDGSFRMCVDYRALNALTIKNSYPLPNIDDLMNQVHGAKIFSKIDLHSGYHQIRVREEDIPKTAFRTRYGLFEFTVLPFGLTNAPATFMNMMQTVFKNYLDKSVIVFLDDILIYSKTIEEHKIHVKEVLETLRKEKLYCKKSKCEFFRERIPFLGHTLSSEGKGMEEDKVKAINDWPTPKNADEVASFVGLAGWYQEFIRHFSHICIPLNKLKQKDVPFRWTEIEDNAFNTLKKAISTAPVLMLPDPKLPFVIMTDASGVATGASLNQDQGKGLQPVAFLSKKLLDAETRYPTHEQELLAVILALKKWRHHVYGSPHPIKIQTDNKSLIYLGNQPNMTNRQRRWVEFLSQFKLNIEYIKGNLNIVADALSRRIDHQDKEQKVQAANINCNAITYNNLITTDTDNLVNEIKKGYEQDEECKRILQGKTVQEYMVKDGLIQCRDNPNRILISKKDKRIQTKIIYESHDATIGGHLGIAKTTELIMRRFIWRGMHQDVKDYVTSCVSCQTSKPSNQLPMGLLKPLPIPDRNWEIISMDLITQLPRTRRGNDAIIVVVDKLSKMAHFLPSVTAISAPELARLIYDGVVRLHGVPKGIISDRDVRFTSNFWRSLWELTGTKLLMSTAYHPQTDGQTERMNRTLEDILRTYTNYEQNDWDEQLSSAEFAYNNSIQASTGFTPFYLNSGQHPNLPITSSIPNDELSSNPTANEMVTTISETITKAKQNILAAQQRQSIYANEKRREVIFKLGDKVLLSTQNIRNQNQAPKLAPKYIGPFAITRVVSDVAYQLELPSNMKIHNVFHVSKLRKYVDGAEEFPDREVIVRSSPVIVDGEEAWEVERVVRKRTRKVGHRSVVEYFVLWKNYPDWEGTWEPASNLKLAQESVNKFESSLQLVNRH